MRSVVVTMSSPSSSDKLSYASENYLRRYPCDVTFLIGADKVEVKGHKSTIAAVSRVMYDLFESGEGTFPFPNLNVVGFKLMLEYIYKLNANLDSEMEAARLLQVAKYFKIQDLTDKAVDKLEGLWNNGPCLTELLTESLTLELPDLTNFVLACICLNGKEAIESEGFLKLKLETMNLIISNDNLQVPNEIFVFEAAVRWAEHQILKLEEQVSCKNIRAKLGPALKSIRLPLIPISDFITEIQLNPAREKIFIAKELNQVLTSFVSNQIHFYLDEERRKSIKARLKFPSTLRNLVTVPPVLNRRLFLNNEVEVVFDSRGGDDGPPRKLPRVTETESTNNNLEEEDKSDSETKKGEKITKSFLTADEKEYIQSHPDHDISKLYQDCRMVLQLGDHNNSIILQEPYVIKSKSSFPWKDPLYFPNLQTFNVKYLLDVNNPSDFTTQLKSISASKLMFVRTNNYQTRNFLKSIYSLKNADWQVNGVTIFKIDKFNHTLTISRFNQQEILKGFKEIKLVHINLEFISLKSLKVFPSFRLVTLTLKNVIGIQMNTNWGEFLALCIFLEEFTCDDFGYRGEKKMKSSLVLSDLGNSSRLRKLSVRKVYLDLNIPANNILASFPKLEELYISDSVWVSEINILAPKLFPNLKKAQIRGDGFEVGLISQLLKINSLVWLAVWEMQLFKIGFQNENERSFYRKALKFVRKVLVDAGLPYNNDNDEDKNVSKSFLLQRPTSNEPWIGTDIEGADKNATFGEWDFEHFSWNCFYKDYQHYRQINEI